MNEVFGFDGTDSEIAHIWAVRSLGWGGIGSPWRPSVGDLFVYKKLCGETLLGDVLILGSTPEIRDLVSEKCKTATVVDISAEMLLNTSALLKKADPAREIWVKADWSMAPLIKERYDLVVGDMVWWVLSIQKQHEVRDAIASFLRPDGLFVGRLHVNDCTNDMSSSEKHISHYLRSVRTTPERTQVIRGEMLSFLYDYYADRMVKRLDKEMVKKILLEATALAEDREDREFLLNASDKLVTANWTSQAREDIFSLLLNKFTLIGEEHAIDYESKSYPIIALRKM